MCNENNTIKKILIIATTPLQQDGITRIIRQIVKHADRKEFHFGITIPYFADDDIKEELIDEEVQLYYLPNRLKKPMSYINELSKVIKKNQYHVVHIHGNSATMAIDAIAAYRGGAAKRIVHSHNSSSDFYIAHRLLKPFCSRITTDRIACSNLAGDFVFSKAFRVINNGIDCDKFKYHTEIRKNIREGLHINDNEILLGHIGRFCKQKNQRKLIEIFAAFNKQNPNSKLLMIGDGPEYNSVYEYVESLGVQEQIIIIKSTEFVQSYMMAMDVFVLPSLFEGLVIAGIEAQATGLPVICSDTISNELAVTDLVHFVSLDDDAIVWANKIALLLNTHIYRDTYSKEIENKGYSIMDSVRKIEAIYRSQ